MAIKKRSTTRIHPIDLPQNAQVAVGVTLPFDGPAVFNSSYNTKDQVKSNLINLLLTSPGERLLNPTFGVGIRQYLFEQTLDRETIKLSITDGADIHIPEIEIVEVIIKRENMETNPELHIVRISIHYKVIQDRSYESVQLNFY
tara:strand:+ start:332 stop:763 length:432 start_codon:yes stop_codon:yes gene_type:complete